MGKRATAALVLALGPIGLAGCNTMEGLGQDLRQLGRAIERAAQD